MDAVLEKEVESDEGESRHQLKRKLAEAMKADKALAALDARLGPDKLAELLRRGPEMSHIQNEIRIGFVRVPPNDESFRLFSERSELLKTSLAGATVRIDLVATGPKHLREKMRGLRLQHQAIEATWASVRREGSMAFAECVRETVEGALRDLDDRLAKLEAECIAA